MTGALSDANQAIKINPNSVRAYTARVYVRGQSGDFKGGLADLAQALPLASVPEEKATVYFNRAEVYLAMNNQKAAVNDLRAAVAAAPDFAVAHDYLAWTLAYTLDTGYNEALGHAQRAVELDANADNYDTLGLVYYRLKQYAQAVEAYDHAIAMDPEMADFYQRRGDTNKAWNKGKAALADYQKYLELQPDAEDRKEVETLIASLGGKPSHPQQPATTPAPTAVSTPVSTVKPVTAHEPTTIAPPKQATPSSTSGGSAEDHALKGQELSEQGDLPADDRGV